MSQVHPSTILHGNGKNGDQVHNIYGMDWAKLVKESLQKLHQMPVRLF